ncbi:hypothetical protein AAE02nite_14870 [Adhaeribacter aerolatus]|uniref:Translocation protein TolB n=1 Tax=Adhaeribacter aerolatus TaxID=670289 RepID=A0A512AVT5_9BACT|nr:PD40 domain-containing protein [Adhaeribacter aerolatus]GEO03823.1 hypothetical protein AAE02nite_14870 [Adhaeribacter aerolatus]
MVKFYKSLLAVPFIAALLFLGANKPVQAQVAPETFGMNRIQYKQFKWQYLSTQNFNVYYYGNGRENARLTAEYAEKELKRITSLIGYFPYSKTTLILYASVADLRQSNIGLNNDQYQTGGETLFLKNKIELAFEGSQTEFKKALSLNVSQLLLHDMMYGGSLKEVLQSSYMLRLPEWFLSGGASYIAEGWNVEMDNYMRDMVIKNVNKKPEVLFVRNQRLAGQSVWNYISERYGYTSIQNILNLTRITRDIEVGIASSLNVPYKKFMRDWQKYYTQMNPYPGSQLTSLDRKDLLVTKNRRSEILSQPTFSPNGSKLAFVQNDRGRYKIKVVDVNRKRTFKVRKGGHKTPDQKVDYKAPLLAWKSERQLNIIEVKRAQPIVNTHYFDRKNHAFFNNLKESIFGRQSRGILSQFTQILNIDYSEDGRLMIMTAVKNGQSDIFLFQGNSRQAQQLTNDIYDDKNATFLKGRNAIVFSSNRWQDSLGTDKPGLDKIVDNFDLFLLDLDRNGARPKQLVASISNELAPIAEDNENILFLSEQTGIRSLHRYNLVSGERQRVSNFVQNIKMFDYDAASKKLAFIAADRNKEYVYYFPNYALNAAAADFKTVRQKTLEDRTLRTNRPAATPEKKVEPAAPVANDSTVQTPETITRQGETPQNKTVNPENYQFDTEPKQPAAAPQKTIATRPVAPGPDGVPIAGPLKYDLRFSINNVVSSVYQDALMGFGLIAEVGMSDMFEDHRIHGGAFIVTDLRTSNFYAEYSNLKKRYDWRLSYLKQTIFRNFTQNSLRYSRQEFTPSISYPLTHTISIRALPKLLHSRYSITNFLSEPDSVDMFASLGGEFVYDNSIATGINMMEGTRMKVGISTFKELNESNKNFNRLYVDLRHYQKIHRQITWANRVSYGHYFGNDPKRYLLGGVDNWLFNKEDEDTQSADRIFHGQSPADLFYQQFATPMRGFDYNARRGHKLLVFNSELRVPIVQYLFQNSTLGSGFFRNLQLTAFSDVGTAYNGSNPFSRRNSFNTQILGGRTGDAINTNPFQAIVINYRNPFLFGYGVGARTTLLGMYGKVDVAWGEENFERRGPKVYVSLGYDF